MLMGSNRIVEWGSAATESEPVVGVAMIVLTAGFVGLAELTDFTGALVRRVGVADTFFLMVAPSPPTVWPPATEALPQKSAMLAANTMLRCILTA